MDTTLSYSINNPNIHGFDHASIKYYKDEPKPYILSVTKDWEECKHFKGTCSFPCFSLKEALSYMHRKLKKGNNKIDLKLIKE